MRLHGDALAAVERARQAEEVAARTTRGIDYARMRKAYPRQKAVLTRAVKSGDINKVVLACVAAVAEWDEIGAWPDDWSRWQRALDDIFPVFQAPLLDQLRSARVTESVAAGETTSVAGGDATAPLVALLAEAAQAEERWRTTRTEEDRLAWVSHWCIAITHPGRRFGDDDHLGSGDRCTPTVLTRDTGDEDDHLSYKGACLGCGWVADREHLIWSGEGENGAAEDANDHAFPGWRDLPIVESVPHDTQSAAGPKALARWLSRTRPLLPDGWIERGGPIRTSRSGGGGRHVPGRVPLGGGYDMGVVGEEVLESVGGQLLLF